MGVPAVTPGEWDFVFAIVNEAISDANLEGHPTLEADLITVYQMLSQERRDGSSSSLADAMGDLRWLREQLRGKPLEEQLKIVAKVGYGEHEEDFGDR